MSRAVYPGTFDPVTRGHLDIIRRASSIFDELIVGVGNNPSKKTAFTLRERAAMMRAETRELRNVKVLTFNRLVTQFVQAQNASFIEFEFISARLIKEISSMGGDVGKLVTPAVEKKLKAKFKSKASAK